MGTLVRPDGPVKIERTRVLNPEVLLARLAGASNDAVAVVRHSGRHFFVAPGKLGGVTEIDGADSLMHGLHTAVDELGDTVMQNKKTSKVKEATR